MNDLIDAPELDDEPELQYGSIHEDIPASELREMLNIDNTNMGMSMSDYY